MQKLTILITTGCDDDLRSGIERIAPSARIITRDQFDADPGLVEQADVVFGNLKADAIVRAARLKWLQGTGAGMGWTKAACLAADRRPSSLTQPLSPMPVSTPCQSASIFSVCC
ncbi:MAG: hypothetical protein J7M14_04885 [Planctomycetes bacterium]|nr:hypothetical protein [Planctomycetota bacterium]